MFKMFKIKKMCAFYSHLLSKSAKEKVFKQPLCCRLESGDRVQKITVTVITGLQKPSWHWLQRTGVAQVDKVMRHIIVILPWTSRYPRLLLMGSVLTWHMYQPLSTSCTLAMCSFHSLCSRCDSDTRWLRVMMLLWIVRMVWVSTLTHATYNQNDTWDIRSLSLIFQ